MQPITPAELAMNDPFQPTGIQGLSTAPCLCARQTTRSAEGSERADTVMFGGRDLAA